MKLTRDFISLGISKLINMPLLLIEMAFIGRILGPKNFGQWSLLIAVATMLHSFFINWTQSITLKFGCEEWSQKKSLTETLNARFPIVFFAFLLCLLLLLMQPMDWLSQIYSLKPELAWLIFLNTVSLWLTFEAQSNMQAMNLLSSQALITPFTTSISIIFLLTILFNVKNSDLILMAIGFSSIRILIWGSAWIYSLKKSTFFWRLPQYTHIKDALYFSWPLLPSLTLGYLSNWSDHIFLSWYSNTKEVGLWGASYEMMVGIISINGIFVTALLPWVINRNQQSSETLKFYLSEIIPTLLSLWLFVVILFVTFFPLLFSIVMGEQFIEASQVLLILGMSILTNAFSSFYGILFNVQNRLKYALLYNLIMVIINVSLSLILIPKMGAVGAAIGTSVSYLIGHYLYIIDQHRFLNLPLDKTGTLFIVTIFIGILQYFSGVQWWIRICFYLFSLMILMITIRKIGSIKPRFLTQFFMGMLGPIGIFLNRMLVTAHVNE